MRTFHDSSGPMAAHVKKIADDNVQAGADHSAALMTSNDTISAGGGHVSPS